MASFIASVRVQRERSSWSLEGKDQKSVTLFRNSLPLLSKLFELLLAGRLPAWCLAYRANMTISALTSHFAWGVFSFEPCTSYSALLRRKVFIDSPGAHAVFSSHFDLLLINQRYLFGLPP